MKATSSFKDSFLYQKASDALERLKKALDPASMSAAQLVWAVFRNVGKIEQVCGKSARKRSKAVARTNAVVNVWHFNKEMVKASSQT